MTIIVEIPKGIEKQIQQSVAQGDIEAARHLLLEAVIPSVEAYFIDATKKTDDLLGMFANEPELINQMVSEAMAAREKHPLRLPSG